MSTKSSTLREFLTEAASRGSTPIAGAELGAAHAVGIEVRAAPIPWGDA
jgi:hypothetical protein